MWVKVGNHVQFFFFAIHCVHLFALCVHFPDDPRFELYVISPAFVF